MSAPASSCRSTHLARALPLVAVLAACGGEHAAPSPPPPTVRVVTVERRDVALFVEAVGTFDGYVNADIRARVGGFLERQSYKEGGPVKAGDLLFTIQKDQYEATVSAARAALERARVDEGHARVQLERNEGLVKTGVLSRQDLDTSAATAATSASQVRAAEAELRRALLDLSYTEVRSPIDGIAGVALVRIGNLVGQDTPTLLTTVSQVNPLRVNFPMSEIDYVKYPDRFKHFEIRTLAWAQRQFRKLESGGTTEEGDPGVELVLSDGTRYPRRALIVTANRQVDPSTGTIQLQALVPNPDGTLRPGQFGKVRVPRVDEGKDVVAVPEKALISVQGTYSVAVVRPDSTIELRRVEVGPSAPFVRVIRSGLQGGERVVVDGVQKVQNGARVTAKEAPPGAASPAGSAAPTEPGR